jgi:2-isopropylmalate synthase
LFDGDIEALVMQAETDAPGPWQLVEVQVSTKPGEANADIKLKHIDGRAIAQSVTAAGPVDAIIKAIEQATQVQAALCKFEVRSVSLGEDAQGEALITVDHDGRSYRGVGLSTNIIEAAALAFLEVVNRIETTRNSAERRSVDRTGITQADVTAI